MDIKSVFMAFIVAIPVHYLFSNMTYTMIAGGVALITFMFMSKQKEKNKEDVKTTSSKNEEKDVLNMNLDDI